MTPTAFPSAREPSSTLDVVGRTMTTLDAVQGTTFVPLADIKKHPELEQRSHYRKVDELAASIKEHGQLQPIGIWKTEGTLYLIWGHTRVRALESELCGGRDAYARIYTGLTLDQARQLAFVENFSRDDLSLYDQAQQITRSLANKWSKSLVATLTHLDRRTVHRLELLAEAAKHSEAFAAASRQQNFPLRAAEVFHSCEGWRVPEEVLAPLCASLVDTPGMSVPAFARQLNRLLPQSSSDTSTPKTPPKPVDTRGNFRMPSLKVKAESSVETYDAAIALLQENVKHLRSLRKKAAKSEHASAEEKAES